MRTEEQRAVNRAHYQKNKQQYLDRNKRRVKEFRDVVLTEKDKPCSDCGVRYPYYVMDFDHVRGNKSFNIGGPGLNKVASKKRLMEEIDKCNVVCSNCHRERTHQRNAFVSPLATNELEE